MEKQSKEESLLLWEMEKEGLSKLPEQEAIDFVAAVDKVINDGTLTYNDFIADIADYFGTLENTDDIAERREQIKNMYIYLTNKYNGGNEE